MALETIKCPYYNVSLSIDRFKQAGTIDSSDICEVEGEPQEPLDVALSTIEDMILASAVSGIDVTSPEFCEAVETVVDSVTNRFG